MKKIYTLLVACITFVSVHATSYTISIVGFGYSPSSMTVSIGDVITIQAMASHPTAQVDLSVWNANGTTTLSSGWGVKTADYTFTITSVNPIYYVCQNHVASGMKGQIQVSSTGVQEHSKALNRLSIFPIPATEKMNVNYTLDQTGMVSFDLIGLNGQHLASLNNEVQTAGIQQKAINIPSGMAPGVYFLRISINGCKAEERLISIN